MTDSETTNITGIHPKDVAKDFNVHLRTVFRWVELGFLISKNGRIDPSYKESVLPDWLNSITLKDACRILDITPNGLAIWRRGGLVETVKPFGFHRVLKSSVSKIQKRLRTGSFSSYKDYGPRNIILKITGIGEKTLNKLIRNGKIPTCTGNDSKRMIPTEELERIAEFWESTCSISDALRIMKIGIKALRTRIKEGKIKTVRILEKQRVLLNSIPKNSETKKAIQEIRNKRKAQLKNRLEGPKLRLRAKKRMLVRQQIKKEKEKIRTRLRLERKFLAKKAPLPKRVVEVFNLTDHVPAIVKVPGFGEKRLTTKEEAAKTLGKSPGFVEGLYKKGTLRCEFTEDNIYPYIASLEILINKIRRGDEI